MSTKLAEMSHGIGWSSPQRPRRVVVNGRFLTQRTTGVQRFAREVLAGIDRLLEQPRWQPWRGRITVLAPVGSPEIPMQHVRFNRVGNYAGNLWEQIEFPMFSGDALLLSFGAMGPLIRRSQIVTIHDAAVARVPETYGSAFRLWYRLALPILASRSTSVFTVSSFSKNEVVEVFGAEPSRVHVVGEGWQHIERHEADTRVLHHHGLIPGRYVLAVGSPAKHKNFDVIVRAVKLLGELDFQVAFCGAVDRHVFGVGPLARGTVKALGYVSDAELRALYEHAGAFVFPSRYEGFGIPPLEAMASGCPVICSNRGAIPETCGDAAMYFAPDDAHALAGLLRRVMADERLRADLRQRGLRRVREFSWDSAAEDYLRVLERLAPDGGVSKDSGESLRTVSR